MIRENINNMKMFISDTIIPYLTKINQIRDELVVVGKKVEDEELVRTTLKGFSKPWDSFVRGIVVVIPVF
jgi:hypothetical protein